MWRIRLGSALVFTCFLAVCFGQERRATMGFMGMRGKKDTTDLEEFKRAPSSMGFQGVRGKKDNNNELNGGNNNPLNIGDNGGAGIAGLTGIDGIAADEPFLEEFKRAPSGFMGMRGKKAPAMGFMGMRGKKDNDYPWWDSEDKRAPASGFFGMRGKKAPASGFFGMRGKKGPSSSGFFGMRGKKGPSGFMGVRGKKDGTDELDTLLQILRESAARQEMEEMMDDSRAKRYATGISDSLEDYHLSSEADLV